MYSYEDRLRAVRLHLNLDKRIKASITRLGYRTKNSLKSWHREYERCHDLRTGYVRSRPRYSVKQMHVPVDYYLSHYRSASATLRALGHPSRGTLAAWIEEPCPKIGKRVVGRVAGGVPKSQEAKQAAVIELCTREESAHVVAQKIGVSRSGRNKPGARGSSRSRLPGSRPNEKWLTDITKS
jgi:transposase-like protein